MLETSLEKSEDEQKLIVELFAESAKQKLITKEIIMKVS